MSALTIRRLDAAAAEAAVPALSAILRACIAGGASIGFMHDCTQAEAHAFWTEVAEAVAEGSIALLVAEAEGAPVGTVQLGFATLPNQPHRADVKKLMVDPPARRRGIGAALMQAVEALARAENRTLLCLDTATGGGAEGLYARLGWQRVGIIPDYALWPDGRFCDTTLFYKRLA